MSEPLLNRIPHEEFDYQTLLDAIQGYAQPRMKISRLLDKGKLELDTDPPPGFATHTRSIPFAVRCYTLPSLFAGKMHALLFRK